MQMPPAKPGQKFLANLQTVHAHPPYAHILLLTLKEELILPSDGGLQRPTNVHAPDGYKVCSVSRARITLTLIGLQGHKTGMPPKLLSVCYPGSIEIYNSLTEAAKEAVWPLLSSLIRLPGAQSGGCRR